LGCPPRVATSEAAETLSAVLDAAKVIGEALAARAEGAQTSTGDDA